MNTLKASLVGFIVCTNLAAAADRLPLTVGSRAVGCREISGSFVSMLDRDQGMLLMSSGPFIGSSRIATPGGEIIEPYIEKWNLDTFVLPDGASGAFAAIYPFLGDGGNGCVAFDTQRFSSEGDLASYLRWLAEEIYLKLPTDERHRHSAFALRERQVELTIHQQGYKPLALSGKEGSTLAFRVAGHEGTYLLLPFILDESTGRLAAKLMHTKEPFWQSADKNFIRWLTLDPSDPARPTDPVVVISTQMKDESDQAVAEVAQPQDR